MTLPPDPYVGTSTVAPQTVDQFGRPIVIETVEAPAQVVVERPVASTAVAATTSTRRRYRFDSFIVGLVGLGLTLVGLIAMTRAGFDGNLEQPVVAVLGFNHTATLGLIEAAFGVILLIGAAAGSRSSSMFFGLLLGVGAVVGAVQSDSFERSLALETGWAWIVAICAGVVVLSSLLIPRMSVQTDRVESGVV